MTWIGLPSCRDSISSMLHSPRFSTHSLAWSSTELSGYNEAWNASCGVCATGPHSRWDLDRPLEGYFSLSCTWSKRPSRIHFLSFSSVKGSILPSIWSNSEEEEVLVSVKVPRCIKSILFNEMVLTRRQTFKLVDGTLAICFVAFSCLVYNWITWINWVDSISSLT